MKKILFVLACVLLGCEDSPEVKAIKDHLQTYDNSKLDLQVVIKSIEEVGFIKVSDSIKIIDSLIFELALVRKSELEREIIKKRKEIEINNDDLQRKKRYEDPRIYRIYKDANDNINRLLESYIRTLQEDIDNINSGIYNSLSFDIRNYYRLRSRYDSLKELSLAVKYKCKYEFRNPLLNGIKQETTNIFVLDTLRNKVLMRL